MADLPRVVEPLIAKLPEASKRAELGREYAKQRRLDRSKDTLRGLGMGRVNDAFGMFQLASSISNKTNSKLKGGRLEKGGSVDCGGGVTGAVPSGIGRSGGRTGGGDVGAARGYARRMRAMDERQQILEQQSLGVGVGMRGRMVWRRAGYARKNDDHYYPPSRHAWTGAQFQPHSSSSAAEPVPPSPLSSSSFSFEVPPPQSFLMRILARIWPSYTYFVVVPLWQRFQKWRGRALLDEAWIIENVEGDAMIEVGVGAGTDNLNEYYHGTYEAVSNVKAAAARTAALAIARATARTKAVGTIDGGSSEEDGRSCFDLKMGKWSKLNAADTSALLREGRATVSPYFILTGPLSRKRNLALVDEVNEVGPKDMCAPRFPLNLPYITLSWLPIGCCAWSCGRNKINEFSLYLPPPSHSLFPVRQ